MIQLILETTGPEPTRVLCLGAHCDDIEIGCGGTLLKMAAARPNTHFDWVIFCSDDVRSDESRNASAAYGLGAGNIALHFLDCKDGYLPYDAERAKVALSNIASDLNPDLIFTHYREDAHQDHRFVSQITGNLFRNHLVLEYEIPKFDGDLGNPNCYVVLDERIVSRKSEILLDSYPSQISKHWFTEETFRSLLRLRGIESGRGNQYAEAFYCHKQTIAPF